MNVLVYLLPMALVIGLGALGAFLWSLRSGQYDDLEGAALRILNDDDLPIDSEQRSPDDRMAGGKRNGGR